MRTALVCAVSLAPFVCAAQVFRCDEPKGVAMWSVDGHKVASDGYAGVKPVVIVEDKEMRVVWGDTKRDPRATEKVWRAFVFHRTSETISAVAVDEGPGGSASMLYSIDLKRRFLYLSTHKNSVAVDGFGASTFVSKCLP